MCDIKTYLCVLSHLYSFYKCMLSRKLGTYHSSFLFKEDYNSSKTDSWLEPNGSLDKEKDSGFVNNSLLQNSIYITIIAKTFCSIRTTMNTR